MTEVSVRELKNKLSEYLRRAEAGEEIAVTRGGKRVAALTAAPKAAKTTEEKLDEMERLGMIRRARGGKYVPPKEMIRLHGEGPSVSEMVLADRGDLIP